MPAELRQFLHDFIDAVAGAGHSDRLHAQLDAVGKPADPAPAVEVAPADTSVPVEAVPADVTVPADELASFRAWQASVGSGEQAAPVAAETVTDAEA